MKNPNRVYVAILLTLNSTKFQNFILIQYKDIGQKVRPPQKSFLISINLH